MEFFRKLLRYRTQSAVVGIILLLIGLGVCKTFDWELKRVFARQTKELLAAVRPLSEKNNDNAKRVVDEMKAMESRFDEILAKLRANVKANNDDVIAITPKAQPPVVLAVFPPGETSRPMLEGLGWSTPKEGPSASPASTPFPNLALTGDCKLEYLRESNSPEDTAKQIRDRMSKENIVLIIGHQSSQAVKELNQELYESKGFVNVGVAMPLILPAATNPALTQSPSKGIHHILRLPATDELQIARVKDLLMSLNAERITLVVDNSNAAYSSYIAQALILGPKGANIVESVGVALGGDGFSPKRFLDSDPDTVVFVGMEIQADLLLQGLAQDKQFSPKRKLNLVFTDGVAGEGFQHLSRELMRTKLDKKVRMYVTGPFPTTTARGNVLSELPNFKNYGIAARQLAKDLIEDAREKGDLEKGDVTIDSVLKVLQRRLTQGRTTVLAEMSVKFDLNGDVLNGQEHVYEQGSEKAWHSILCSCGGPTSNKIDSATVH